MQDELAIKAIQGADTARRLVRRIVEGSARLFRPEVRGRGEQARIQKKRQKDALAKTNQYLSKFKVETRKLAARFAEGEITASYFRGGMLTEIRYLLVTAAAAGAGGMGYLGPDDIAAIDAEVRRQATFLDNWVAQLERQAVEDRNVDYIANRANMYAGAGWRMAGDTIDRVMYKQFPTLPFQPKDWTTLCKNGCKCNWVWVILDDGRGDADVTWRLGIAEHCETCDDRAAALNPLKIREFNFVDAPDFSTLMVEE